MHLVYTRLACQSNIIMYLLVFSIEVRCCSVFFFTIFTNLRGTFHFYFIIFEAHSRIQKAFLMECMPYIPADRRDVVQVIESFSAQSNSIYRIFYKYWPILTQNKELKEWMRNQWIHIRKAYIYRIDWYMVILGKCKVLRRNSRVGIGC